jgi:hypothetical protein
MHNHIVASKQTIGPVSEALLVKQPPISEDVHPLQIRYSVNHQASFDLATYHKQPGSYLHLQVSSWGVQVPLLCYGSTMCYLESLLQQQPTCSYAIQVIQHCGAWLAPTYRTLGAAKCSKLAFAHSCGTGHRTHLYTQQKKSRLHYPDHLPAFTGYPRAKSVTTQWGTRYLYMYSRNHNTPRLP